MIDGDWSTNDSSNEREHFTMSVRCSAIIALAAVCSTACGRHEEPEAAQAESASAAREAHDELRLSPAEMQRLGVAHTIAAPITFAAQVRGYGVVVSHDAIAQSVADVETAKAASRQSQMALARLKGLANTPGAFSAEALEAAERQASADESALALSRRKLSATWGTESPWKEAESDPRLRDVASGKVKLVRVTFPLGALSGSQLHMLQLAPLGATEEVQRWPIAALWNAPADATLPGRSFFALLDRAEAAEGERLEAWIATGTPLAGTMIPMAAVVISDGEYWCYVEQANGRFERRAIDASRPLNGGYFVQKGITPGEAIVTNGAGLLLARETKPSTEAD